MRLPYLNENNNKNIFSQLETYFDNFWEPIVILDGHFRINQVNSKFLELCSFEKHELLNESPSKIFDQFVGVYPTQGNLKLNISAFEGKIVKANVHSKSGIDIPVKMTFQSFYTDDKKSNWFIAIFIRDISHEVHLKRQLNSTKEFALNKFQISGIIYRQTSMGPAIWLKDPHITVISEKFKTENEITDELIRIGLILTTALGQGNSYTLGLSELPIDNEIVAVCYTTLLNMNKTKNETYVIVAVLYPKVLTSLIDKRIVLENIFKDHFSKVNNFDQLDNEWLFNLKYDLLMFDEGVSNS